MRTRTLVIIGLTSLVALGGLAHMRRQAVSSAADGAGGALAADAHGEGAAGETEPGHAAPVVPGLRTLRVERTAAGSVLALTGEVEADADLTARVGSPVSGRLGALYVKTGETVRAGQTLATVVSQDVAEVRSALVRALAEEQAAARRLRTVRELAAAGALTSKPLEEAQLQYGTAVAAVRQAENAVKAARAARDAASGELERIKQLATSQAYQARPVEEARREEATAQAELDTARAQVKARQAAHDRAQRLLAAGLASRRELESAEADLGEAKARETEALTHLQVARQALTREESIAKQDLYSLGEVRQAQALVREAEREVEHETAELERTRRHLEVATASLAREKRIAQGDLLARQEVQQVEAALALARAEVQAARQSLAAFHGAASRTGASLAIVAPLSGVLAERLVTPGQAVQASTDLFTIINPSRVWVWGNVHAKDLGQVRTGQLAEIRVNSYPDRAFPGRVGLIASALDPKSRTARVRCVVDNRAGLLKPGMFASMNVTVGDTRLALLVPKDAVLDDAGKKVLFVTCTECPEDKPGGAGCGAYDRLEVETGPLFGDRIEIRKGLQPGAFVVVSGQYQLKTALGSGQLEAGCSGH